MSEITGREFMAGLVASVTAAKPPAASVPATDADSPPADNSLEHAPQSQTNTIDFRFAPRHWQTAICFPDDPRKSLVGPPGDLRYGFAKDLLSGWKISRRYARFLWPACRTIGSRVSGSSLRERQSFTRSSTALLLNWN